eukprot:CCRYP_015168-RA/>CCRYP_015168-RA protein AED:0.05 eAED:0.05 QI:650/1/1/1/0.5/0.42/7/592/843
MPSNQTDPNEYLGKVVAHYLQQQSQGHGNGGESANRSAQYVQNSAPQVLDSFSHNQYQQESWTAPSDQGDSSLSTLLATYVQRAVLNSGVGGVAANTTTTASPHAAPSEAHSQGHGGLAGGHGGFHQPLGAAPSFATNQSQLQQPTPSSDANSTALGEQIIASAQLLAAINPSLAAAAITHAFSLSSQQNEQQQLQQQHQDDAGSHAHQQQAVHQQNQQQAQSFPPLFNQQQQLPLDHGTDGPSAKTSSVPTMRSIAPAPSSIDDHINLLRDHLTSCEKPNSKMEIATKQDVRHDNNKKSAFGTAENPTLSADAITTGVSATTSYANNATSVNGTAAAASNSAIVALPAENLSMQRWSLEQLESHAKQLQDSHQPIPQHVAILLASARRREDKQNAKKLANRKAAFSSRARKKAHIDAMTQENMRLRRQAMILSFLPDPVVVIDVDGEITFCSAQMERVLQHKAEDLMRANIKWFISPDSRGKLRKMIQDVVTAEEQAIARQNIRDDDGLASDGNGGNNSSGSDPNVVSLRSSEQSYAMPKAKVYSSEDISNSSGDCLIKKPAFEANYQLSFGREATIGDNGVPSAKKLKVHTDDVIGSSVTANNAGAKLSSLHYHKNSKKKAESDLKSPPELLEQDQHLQPCVHQKHALAPRTSSLLNGKREYQSSSSDSSSSKTKGQFLNSSDSGYRESSDSPKESNESSSSTMSNSDEDGVSPPKDVRRTLPLAPACNICLIRKDLNTIWCELTASIRTRSRADVDSETIRSSQSPEAPSKGKSQSNMPSGETKELLLCFRPILQGGKVGEELRFSKDVKIMSAGEFRRASPDNPHIEAMQGNGPTKRRG